MTWCVAPSVSAQPKSELKQAEQWFKEGDQAEKKGDCATAIDRFRQVLTVKETAQVQLRLGHCLETLNKLAQAQAAYRRGQALAKSAGKQEVADVAQEQLDALGPRVPKIVVDVGRLGPNDGLVVKLDGETIAASVEVPVDPGEHKLTGEAKGYKPGSKTFSAVEGKSARIAVAMAPVVEAAPEVPPDVTSAPPPPAPDKPSKVPGGVLIAAGGVGIGVGIALFAIASGKSSDLDTRCGGSERLACPKSQQADIESEARSVNLLRGISVASGGLGVVGAVVGVILVTRKAPIPKADGVSFDVFPDAWHAQLHVTPSFTGASLFARGAF